MDFNMEEPLEGLIFLWHFDSPPTISMIALAFRFPVPKFYNLLKRKIPIPHEFGQRCPEHQYRTTFELQRWYS